jgi:hypothetical protein
MDTEQICDIWTMFKEYTDKKQIEVVAERFVDLLADYGIPDETLKECIGHDYALDEAVGYYFDDSDEEEDFDDWDE